MAHLDACDVGGKDSSTDVHSWVTYSTRNRLFISVCCISYTSSLSRLYLEFVDISHLQCQRIYIGTRHTKPAWGEVHTVLIIAHPRLKICIMVYHPQFLCKNDNALSFSSISSFLQESLHNQPKKVCYGKTALKKSVSQWHLLEVQWKKMPCAWVRMWSSLKSLSQ